MSKTTKQVQEPSVVDPHNIMDTLCEGPVFLNLDGGSGPSMVN